MIANLLSPIKALFDRVFGRVSTQLRTPSERFCITDPRSESSESPRQWRRHVAGQHPPSEPPAQRSEPSNSRAIIAFDEEQFAATIAAINVIIGKQLFAANAKLENSAYWRNVGYLIKMATSCADRVVRQSIDVSQKSVNYSQMMGLLSATGTSFGYTYDDDDGYGFATIGQIKNEIAILLSPFLVLANRDTEQSNVEASRIPGTTKGLLLTLPQEMFEFVQCWRSQNLQKCLELANLIVDRSQAVANLRFGVRLTAMVLVRSQNFEAAKRALDVAEGSGTDADNEGLYDRLTLGMASAQNIPELVPIEYAPALFWLGSFQKSAGDPAFRESFRKCRDYNFDKYECVLAQVELELDEEMLGSYYVSS